MSGEPRVAGEQCEECGAPREETHNFPCTVRVKWLQSRVGQLENIGNQLLMALESAVSIADEAFLLWDSDNDSRVGKILWSLGSGEGNGYRQDIDDIHEAIASAKAPQ